MDSVARTLPIYVITNEHAREKVVHRNHLFLFVYAGTEAVPIKVRTCTTSMSSTSIVSSDDSQEDIEMDCMHDVFALDITLFQVRTCLYIGTI